MEGYKTVRQYAFDEFTEKKSRFICYAAPVSGEPEAQALITRDVYKRQSFACSLMKAEATEPFPKNTPYSFKRCEIWESNLKEV